MKLTDEAAASYEAIRFDRATFVVGDETASLGGIVVGFAQMEAGHDETDNQYIIRSALGDLAIAGEHPAIKIEVVREEAHRVETMKPYERAQRYYTEVDLTGPNGDEETIVLITRGHLVTYYLDTGHYSRHSAALNAVTNFWDRFDREVRELGPDSGIDRYVIYDKADELMGIEAAWLSDLIQAREKNPKLFSENVADRLQNLVTILADGGAIEPVPEPKLALRRGLSPLPTVD